MKLIHIKKGGSDLNKFEGGFKGKETPTFPYDLKKTKRIQCRF